MGVKYVFRQMHVFFPYNVIILQDQLRIRTYVACMQHYCNNTNKKTIDASVKLIQSKLQLKVKVYTCKFI